MAPPTLTETLDNLYTTTWELRKGETHDNIFSATPLWYWMKDKGKLKTEQGGRFIMYPLEYDKNDTVTWVTKGSTITLNDYEFLTEAKYDWKYLAASMVRFGVDDQQNRGKAQIINLMNAKMNNTQNALIAELESVTFGTFTGNKPYGLRDLVASTSTNTIGGISRSTYTWFANKTTTMTGLSFAVYGIPYMRTMMNTCSLNRTQDRPDIIVTTQTVYEYVEDETMEQKQIVNQKLGDAGFENIQFKGVPIIWSPSCYAGSMYFLNTKYLYLVYDPMLNFDLTEWKPIPDQINDRAAQIIFACAFVVTRSLCQGVLHTIDTA